MTLDGAGRAGRPARLGVVGVVIVLLLSGCARADESGAVPGDSNPPAAPARRTPAPVLTTTGSHSDLGSPQQAAERVKKAAGEVSKKLYFTMPRLVGRNLQAAQDTLQSRGSYFLDQQDATGAGRRQLLDRDWKVCSQQPKAGRKVVITTRVTLKAVKLSESCP